MPIGESDKGNHEIQVALNKDFELKRKLHVKESATDFTALTFMTNNEFNIEITSLSGNISVKMDPQSKIGELITEGKTNKYKKSQGFMYIEAVSPTELELFSRNDDKSRRILEWHIQEATAEYELKLTIDKDVQTSDKPIFGGNTYSGEVKESTFEKSQLGPPTDNTPTPEPQTGTKLPPGAIAGIVIAAIVVIAIICVLVWFFVFHNKPSKEGSGSGQDV